MIDGWNLRLRALEADLAALALDETLDPGAKNQIAKAVVPAIGVKPSGKKAALGGSKLGGRPHVASGFVWPTAKNIWNDGEKEPLALIAQLDLADMAPHDPLGILPKTGRMAFFMLPIEYDATSHKAHTHVVVGDALTELAPPRGLSAAGGVFKEKSLEFFPTVLLPDHQGGGFISLDDENEQKLNRVLKKHGMRRAEIDALLDGPRFSSGRLKGYSPKKDVILLRFFGEALGSESPWTETEMMIVIPRDALQKGQLGDARIVMGEST